ncbi:MAG: hypothetical protein JZD40_05590 [Sulfolobus sp.]|nr:hypothetical protein [Sulfolobus sp.]
MKHTQMIILGTLIAAFSVLFYPLLLIGTIILGYYKKAFLPDFSDSIYSSGFQHTTAWILLALTLAEGFTGFGAGPQTSYYITLITFGLLNRGTSLQIHIILIALLSFFFILHITSGLGIMLLRRGIRNYYVYEYIIPLTMLILYMFSLYLYVLLV